MIGKDIPFRKAKSCPALPSTDAAAVPNWHHAVSAYAPKPNHVEQRWKHAEYDDLPNVIPDDLDRLFENVHNSQQNQHCDQIILHSFVDYAKLPPQNDSFATQRSITERIPELRRSAAMKYRMARLA